MKLNSWFWLFLIYVLCTLPGCGGGSNVVSDDTTGILSIEDITVPAQSGGSGTISVKLVAPKGGPGSGTVTVSSTGSSLVSFTPASQSVNSNGAATFYYTSSEVQADTVVSFTVTVGTLSISKPVTLPGVGTLSLALSLPATADSDGTVTASFANGAKAFGRSVNISSDQPANIAFSSTEQPANAQGQAIFTFRILPFSTDTTATFTATAAATNQTIVKSILIPGVTVTPPVVTNPPVNSISFVSASPTYITLKGVGGLGRSETSIVSFIVRDVTGQPLVGQTVDFTLDTSVGGLSLNPASVVSDSSGSVKTMVIAGVVATPVRVTATVRGTTISVKSDQLTVSTGLPHQNGLSLSSQGVATPHPEAWGYDNVEVPIIAMLSDHFGNPVPDGTSVYFTTYGGSIEPAGTTQNGIATVKWRSQDPRPADGRAKILVYAIGEESFTDLIALNGLADPGEFTDLPEAFLAKSWTTDSTRRHCNPSLLSDYNPSLDSTGCLVRDPSVDPAIDFNGDGVYNTGDGKFNGVLQGSAYLGAPRSLHIFKNFQIIMSGSDAFISAIGPLDSNTRKPGLQITGPGTTTEVAIFIRDVNGNIMPEDTTTSFSFAGTCLSATPSSFKYRSIEASTSIKNTCTGSSSDTLYVTVTTPKGNVTRDSINISF
ncbi:MAG: hypothetical protein WC007_01850 [Pelobacteraceae bacterium]